MRTLLKFYLVSVFVCYSFGASAWNGNGHMLVAQIAYNQLTPVAKQKADELIVALQPLPANSNTFVTAGPWADDIKSETHEFDSWHFLDHGFTTDDTEFDNTLPEEHVAWAIVKQRTLLTSTTANQQEKAKALRFLIHFVADAHQPLHCSTLYRKDFPKGDRGGNLFKLNSKPDNLHALWDQAIGQYYPNYKRPLSSKDQQTIVSEAKRLTATYKMEGDPRLTVADPYKWTWEGFELAKNSVYQGIEVNDDYRKLPDYVYTSSQIAEEQIVLAGYRLAYDLNQLLK